MRLVIPFTNHYPRYVPGAKESPCLAMDKLHILHVRFQGRHRWASRLLRLEPSLILLPSTLSED